MTSTAFVDVTTVPMDRPGAAPDQVVVVEGDRITAVGSSATVAIPDGATVIDCAGRHLIPGLADMHVHLGMWDPDPRHLILYLAEGTTLVRALSGSPANARWRDRVAAGELPGPTILTSGPTIIGGIDGSPDELAALPIVQPTTVAEVIDEVRARAAGWADLVKVYDGLAPEVYLAAISTAKDEGLYVTGHLLDELSLEDIVAAGLDEVAHLDELNFRHWLGTPANPDFALDWGAIPSTARLLAGAGMAVVSNLSADESMAELLDDTSEVLARAEYRVVRPQVVEAWRHGRQTGVFEGQGPYRRDLELPFFGALLDGLRNAGVLVLVGTDTSQLVEGAVPSRIHRELELLVESGYSPGEALQAATSTAADVVARMGRDGAFGRIVPGHRADLVLLNGNPLDDVSQTRNRSVVMVRGTYYRQVDLDRMVDEFLATYTVGATP
jgi:imidazolonepropionase-like amidohydrolase